MTNVPDYEDDHEVELREGESIIGPLPEDNGTPFSPPTDPIDDAAEQIPDREAGGRLDPTHPDTDDANSIEATEFYDEGLSGAAEAEEPNAASDVVGYDPLKDERKHDPKRSGEPPIQGE